jgi:hypothetical protein
MKEFSEEFKAKLHEAMRSYDGRFALGQVTNGNFYEVLNTIMQEASKELTVYAREGWMCSVDFLCEVGSATGGNTVYPSKKNLQDERLCVIVDAEEPTQYSQYCYPKRVYVMDADEVDKLRGEPSAKPS